MMNHSISTADRIYEVGKKVNITQKVRLTLQIISMRVSLDAYKKAVWRQCAEELQ